MLKAEFSGKHDITVIIQWILFTVMAFVPKHFGVKLDVLLHRMYI